MFTTLEMHDVWRRQVRDGDGAHPRSDGYTALFELVAPAWDEWLHRWGHRGPERRRQRRRGMTAPALPG